MKRFRKRPIVIEAVQVTEETFSAPHPNPEHLIGPVYDPLLKRVYITTLEGLMTAAIGDWIIIGIRGEMYPCKDEIFRATYEELP